MSYKNGDTWHICNHLRSRNQNLHIAIIIPRAVKIDYLYTHKIKTNNVIKTIIFQ